MFIIELFGSQFLKFALGGFRFVSQFCEDLGEPEDNYKSDA